MKKIGNGILVLLLMIHLITPAYAAVQSGSVIEDKVIAFSDVDTTTDIGIAIYEMAKANIINGYPNGTFGPEKGLKRSEAVKIINLEFGFTEQDPTGFPDVSPNDWYAEHAYISKKMGYITGYTDGTFKQGNLIKRQEVCAILVRILKRFDMEIKLGPIPVLVSDTIPDWAKDDVHFVLSNGFMLTDPDGRFRATEPITRAEFCLLFAQFLDIAGQESGGSEESSNGDSGNGGIPKPGDDNTTPEEESVVASIRSVYLGLQSPGLLDRVSTLTPSSQQIVSSIRLCFESVLAKDASGVKITPDYVKNNYYTEINNVRELYNGMTDAQQKSLRSALLSYLLFSDIEVLQDYFLR